MAISIAADETEMIHVPVLVEEVVRLLLHEDSKVVVDGTIGCGGHARAILEANENVRLIGVDTDRGSLEVAEKRLSGFEQRVRLYRTSFARLPEVLDREFGIQKVDGILLDLGVSTYQLDDPSRGLSYLREGPLDMRMSEDVVPASELIARSGEREIATIIQEYGEVSGSKRIARAVCERARAGKMRTTFDLKEAVSSALGKEPPPFLLSKVFQAFRIAVNEELESIEMFLSRVRTIVRHKARLVFLSYHSLEDRKIKRFMSRESRDCVCPPGAPTCVCGHKAWLKKLTPKPVKPGLEEMTANPRSRSAKLRAAEIL